MSEYRDPTEAETDTTLKLEGCIRVEVITDEGRQFVDAHKDNIVCISMQDDRATMKIFIKRNENS